MGMGVDNSNGIDARNGRRRHRSRPMAEINVTPFVDVMLVLLIIFMVTAPLMTVDIPVNLPKTAGDAQQKPQEPKEPLIITMDEKGRVFVQNTALKPDELVPRLSAIKKAGGVDDIEFHGDEHLPYGDVMKTIGEIREAGFRVSLTTLPDDGR